MNDNQINIYKNFPQERIQARIDEIRKSLLEIFRRKKLTKYETNALNELIDQLINLKLKIETERTEKIIEQTASFCCPVQIN